MQITHSSKYTIHQVGIVASGREVYSDPFHSRLAGEVRGGQKGVGVRKPISTRQVVITNANIFACIFSEASCLKNVR